MDTQELPQRLSAQLRVVGDEDAVQEGFIRDVKRQAWNSLRNPHGYWYQASRNALRDQHRRRAIEDRAIRSWLEIHSQDNEPGRWSEQDLSDLRKGIEQLRGHRRQLIDLELSGVRPVAAIAGELGISEGAVRVLRHRTYRQLREFISPAGAPGVR